MVEISSGIVSGIGIFLIVAMYMWKQAHDFKANMHAMLGKIEEYLNSKPDKAKRDFEEIKKGESLSEYEQKRHKRMVNTLKRLIVLGAVVGVLVSCVVRVFIDPMYPSPYFFPIPLLVAATLLLVVHLLNSEKCCAIEADEASDAGLWLGVILPSIPFGGELKIVQGTMCPILFGQDWFFGAVLWLVEERKVKLRILSGRPELEKMDEEQFQRWEQYRSNMVTHKLGGCIRILPQRPEWQFTVTNRLVRIEKPHSPWVEREKSEESIHVKNKLYLFDFSRISSSRIKFDREWQNATPVTKLRFFQNPKLSRSK